MHQGPGRTLSIVHLARILHHVAGKNTHGFFFSCVSCVTATMFLFAFPLLLLKRPFPAEEILGF